MHKLWKEEDSRRIVGRKLNKETRKASSYAGRVVAGVGFEPTAFGLWAQRATNCSTPRYGKNMKTKTENPANRTLRNMVAEAGFEPATFGLWARRATELLHSAIYSPIFGCYNSILYCQKKIKAFFKFKLFLNSFSQWADLMLWISCRFFYFSRGKSKAALFPLLSASPTLKITTPGTQQG